MAKIEHVSMFRTGDGREHRDLDLAVAHERFALVQNLLVEQRLVQHIDLTEIDRIARIICETQPAVQEFFAEDMKRGVHRGGVVSLRGEEVPRIMEQNQSTIPHPRDVLGEAIQVGDTVDIDRASADSFSLNVWGGSPRRVHEITRTGKVVAEGTAGAWFGASLLKIKTTLGGAGGSGRPETIIIGSGGVGR